MTTAEISFHCILKNTCVLYDCMRCLSPCDTSGSQKKRKIFSEFSENVWAIQGRYIRRTNFS